MSVAFLDWRVLPTITTTGKLHLSGTVSLTSVLRCELGSPLFTRVLASCSPYVEEQHLAVLPLNFFWSIQEECRLSMFVISVLHIYMKLLQEALCKTAEAKRGIGLLKSLLKRFIACDSPDDQIIHRNSKWVVALWSGKKHKEGKTFPYLYQCKFCVSLYNETIRSNPQMDQQN